MGRWRVLFLPLFAFALGTFVLSGSAQQITGIPPGVPIWPLSSGGSGGTVTSDSVTTFTNKTYDVEGTGNVFSSYDDIWFPSAGCNNATASTIWDLPTSAAAVAACVTGSNTQKGVLDFADSGPFSAQTHVLLPASWVAGIDAKLIWTTTATSGNAIWNVATICTATGATETDDPAFNTPSTATTAAPGTANRLQTSTITSVTATGCAATELLHIQVLRDGTAGGDTLGATARLIGVQITLRSTK